MKTKNGRTAKEDPENPYVLLGWRREHWKRLCGVYNGVEKWFAESDL